MKILTITACCLGLISVVAFVEWVRAPILHAESSSELKTEVFIREPVVQHGAVGLNNLARSSFHIVNDSNQTVTLGEPLRSCTCVSAELDRRELGPGEQGKLLVSIQTGHRRGPRGETIIVPYTRTDGSGTGELIARVLYTAKGVFDIEPFGLRLTREQTQSTFIIHIDPKADQNKILDVRSNHPCISVDASQLPNVTVSLKLDTLDESILNTECLIYTSNPAEDVIRVPVQVRKE